MEVLIDTKNPKVRIEILITGTKIAELTFLWNPGHSGMPTVRTAKHLLLESTTKSVESGTYDVICQFCTVKGMVVESEVLKAQSCALS